MIIDDKFTLSYTVPPSYIDGKGRFTALGIASLAQDLAAAHYSSAGLSLLHMQKMGITWVISKQHFEIKDYPLWADRITVKTWAQPPKGLFCFRDFAYHYTKNGKNKNLDEAFKSGSYNYHLNDLQTESEDELCVRGSSCWIIVDLKTGQPLPPDKKTMGSLTFNTEHLEGKVFPKINLNTDWDIETDFTPTLLDIDINSHVNNLNYIRWILSFMNEEFCKTRLIKTLDTNFVSSAKYGEHLICRCSKPENNICVHSIVRKNDGSEVFKARTEWADETELSRPLKIAD